MPCGYRRGEAAVSVIVDGSVRHQTMDGFGASSRVFDDPHVFNNFNAGTGRAATEMTVAEQDEILDMLYADLKLTRVRPVSPDTAFGAGIEPVNDNSDPLSTDAGKFDFSWKNLDAHIEYLQRARDRGATTYFLSPVKREAWMGVTTASDVAEYSEWLLVQVRRSAELGVRLPYISVGNEPSFVRNTMSGEFIRDVIKDLGPRLRAEGFDTMFVTPDDVRSSDGAAKTAIILADPAARPYVGALATHLYDESVSNVSQMRALADEYNLPLWMTEYYDGDGFRWASLMHELISTHDVSAVDYLWGSFGEWAGDSATLITLKTAGSAYDGYSLTKSYYATGQFSRFIDPGDVRIDAQSSDDRIKATAYSDNDKLVIVAINSGATTLDVTFGLSGLLPAEAVNAVRTSQTENWASLPSITLDQSGFIASLPGNSITTFVAAFPAFADFNDDGTVDADDLSQWRLGFGAAGAAGQNQGDANGDMKVDGADFLAWQRQLGPVSTAVAVGAAAPEPAGWALAKSWIAFAWVAKWRLGCSCGQSRNVGRSRYRRLPLHAAVLDYNIRVGFRRKPTNSQSFRTQPVTVGAGAII
jgi:O-glycosyl hydrolase